MENTRREVSLVLSSGGARGLAHIGAIEELEREGYVIRSVAGCSMGALVGGMYAAGKLAEFKQWMHTIDWRKMLSLVDFSFSISHLVKGEKVIDALKEIVPDVNIEELPIAFCAVATDWENGREVLFRKGSLYEAIRASISIPLFFDPVRRDGMLLVDGGVMNPLPLNRVKRTTGDLLVAVNVSGHYYDMEQIAKARRLKYASIPAHIINRILPSDIDVNYVSLLSRTCSLMIQQNATLMTKLFHPDVLIDMPMNRFGSFAYDKADKIAGIGERKMKKALAQLAECQM